MDEQIKKIIIGSVLLGVGKITFLQLHHGEIFHDPSIVPNAKGKFGIKDEVGEYKECTTIINISDVKIVY